MYCDTILTSIAGRNWNGYLFHILRVKAAISESAIKQCKCFHYLGGIGVYWLIIFLYGLRVYSKAKTSRAERKQVINCLISSIEA